MPGRDTYLDGLLAFGMFRAILEGRALHNPPGATKPPIGQPPLIYPGLPIGRKAASLRHERHHRTPYVGRTWREQQWTINNAATPARPSAARWPEIPGS